MISKKRRTDLTQEQPAEKPKKVVKKKEAPAPKPKPTVKQKVATKSMARKSQHLDVANVINLIETRKGKEAVKILKTYKCKAEEGCGLIKFRGDLCYNHYHMKLRFGRTNHVNVSHDGELCMECKKRPATNKEYCLACFLRLDRAGKIKNKRKRNGKKQAESKPVKKLKKKKSNSKVRKELAKVKRAITRTKNKGKKKKSSGKRKR